MQFIEWMPAILAGFAAVVAWLMPSPRDDRQAIWAAHNELRRDFEEHRRQLPNQHPGWRDFERLEKSVEEVRLLVHEIRDHIYGNGKRSGV